MTKHTLPAKDGYHHLGIRLTPAHYQKLERIRADRGHRSLAQAIADLVESAAVGK